MVRMRMKMEKSRSSLAFEQIHDISGVHLLSLYHFMLTYRHHSELSDGPSFPSSWNSAGPQ